ncbi:MAG: ATP-binding protein [Armatimonadota bacterium]|nr:PAS domain-containing protein [bacterium]
MAALQDITSPERGVLLLDRNHRITHANRRASEVLGIALADLIGAQLPSTILHRPDSADDVVEEVLDSLCGGTILVHRYSAPIYSCAGQADGRVEIYSDITARRELEREILDRNEKLAELNKLLEEAQEQLIHSERLRTLGEMAAGVAHDINNVLGIILGNAQLARRKLGDNTDAMRSIDAIELAARDAAETVRRLREIGKPPDVSSYQVVDLSEIVEDMLKSALPAWRESGSHAGAQVSVETKLSPDCRVLGNASELREALANMLLNAVQAMETSGDIEVRTSRGERYVDLIVADTGIGMSEETRQRLFDPFFTTRGAEGTGLGMSMVDAIAIRHQGKVLVESEKGKGTTITLRLPGAYVT